MPEPKLKPHQIKLYEDVIRLAEYQGKSEHYFHYILKDELRVTHDISTSVDRVVQIIKDRNFYFDYVSVPDVITKEIKRFKIKLSFLCPQYANFTQPELALYFGKLKKRKKKPRS